MMRATEQFQRETIGGIGKDLGYALAMIVLDSVERER